MAQRTSSQESLARTIAVLEAAADRGDREAPRHLATLAAAGIGMPQSWERALDRLLDSAVRGSPAARGQLAVLADTDQVASAHPDVWRDLRRSAKLEVWALPCEKRLLRDSPRTVAIERFLPTAVCRWIIDRSRGHLQPAMVYGTVGADPSRSSMRGNSAFELATILDYDVVFLLLRHRIAATIGVPVQALETSQVLHYEAGEEFALHHDYLDPDDPGHAAEIAARGQRIVTFLIYLNDAFEDGQTDFPALGLCHRGGAGDALYFTNMDQAGLPDARTLHAGRPPTRGEKWVFSQWVRNRAWV